MVSRGGKSACAFSGSRPTVGDLSNSGARAAGRVKVWLAPRQKVLRELTDDLRLD